MSEHLAFVFEHDVLPGLVRKPNEAQRRFIARYVEQYEAVFHQLPYGAHMLSYGTIEYVGVYFVARDEIEFKEPWE